MITRIPPQQMDVQNDIPTQPSYLSIYKPNIKVVGLGGGGTNAVNRMIQLGLTGVDFIAANTDYQALKQSLAPTKIQLGPKETRGLGAGGYPEKGRKAAEESWREIQESLAGADMVFLTAGMGGGTGTGSISVAAKIAQHIKAVTIAIVTTPFNFEMGRRQRNASEGIAQLQPNTNTLITIPNDRLLKVVGQRVTLEVAFRMADDVLRQAVQGITEVITKTGSINIDFANIKNILNKGGGALMSIGQSDGEGKVLKAMHNAIRHPLLEDISLENATGVLINFTSGEDLPVLEMQEAVNFIREKASSQADIHVGVVYDEQLEDKVEVILVITGLGGGSLEETLSGFSVHNVVKTPAVPTTEVEQPIVVAPQRLTEEINTSGFGTKDLDVPAFLRRR